MPQKSFKALTQKSGGLANQILTKVRISPPSIPLDKNQVPNNREYLGIWDTGATGTAITPKVVKELGLIPTGVTDVITAKGIGKSPVYFINVYLPMGVIITGVRATEALLVGDTDVLIGMDVIGLGDFSITNAEGITTMSFRVPSVKEVDYVKVANQISIDGARKLQRQKKMLRKQRKKERQNRKKGRGKR